MAELADAQDSDSCPRKSGAGSSPVIRITVNGRSFCFFRFFI